MPAMLSEIVTQLIDEQEDMETVSLSSNGTAWQDQLKALRPNVLLMSCDSAELSDSARRYLDLQPNLRVLALAANGREAILYELRPHETFMGSISPEKLVQTIRKVVSVLTVIDKRRGRRAPDRR